uniref:ATP synthase F0 subunit 8 n=1 Tax=Acanthochitona mahensis TaxID=1231393 RepID=UPI00286AAD2B|nr:ATP synthase F0 subunit 8 [Acanthochitona mahensis]WLW42186.1 ATP synthase F0 subunit 8 [Acanthochitona mahensis]
MPQLAPLNWILLFFLFWGSIFFIFIFVWWCSGKSYYFSKPKGNVGVVKSWMW